MSLILDWRNIDKAVNDAFYPLLHCTDRNLVLFGGAGSGKSYFAAQKIIYRIFTDWNTIQHRFLCLRKYAPSCRNSVFEDLKNILGAWGLLRKEFVNINTSRMTFYFSNGSRIICAGLSDEERLKSIVGITSTWLEEANELTLKEYLQVDLRMRGKCSSYFQNVLSFNPISRSSWLFNHFFIKEQPDTHVMKSTYKDNTFRGEGYGERLRQLAGQDETFFQIYAQGEWGTLQGLIFQNYAWIPNWNESFPGTIYGLDFGYNSETALIEVSLHDEEYYIREIIYEKKLHGSKLIERLENIKFPKDAIIYADSEAPDRIAELKDNGYRVWPAKKGKGSVKAGLDFMKRRVIKISDNSPNVLSEIESYKYVEDKKSGEIIDEPVKWHDHAMDAVRYAIYTHYGRTMDYTFITSGD